MSIAGAFEGAILSAGRGERLRRGDITMPKPLVEVGGQTLLDRQARAMLAAGARSVVAVVNSETAAIIARRALTFDERLTILTVDTANSMETLFVLGRYLTPGRFLLATVDAVFAPGGLERFVASASRLTAGADALDGALGVTRWRGDKRPLFAALGATGLIQALGDAQSEWVTAGAYFLSTRVLELQQAARDAGLDALRRFLALILRRGMRLGAIEMARAIDVDEPGDLEAARAMIETGTSNAVLGRKVVTEVE